MSIQGYMEVDRGGEAAATYMPAPEPVTASTKARALERGDTVTFGDRDSCTITGVVVRVNQRTASLGTGNSGTRRVPFHLLRHVIDI